MNFVRSSNLSLKYQRFTSPGSKDIGIQRYDVVTKTQFLLLEKGWFSVLFKDTSIANLVLQGSNIQKYNNGGNCNRIER